MNEKLKTDEQIKQQMDDLRALQSALWPEIHAIDSDLRQLHLKFWDQNFQVTEAQRIQRDRWVARRYELNTTREKAANLLYALDRELTERHRPPVHVPKPKPQKKKPPSFAPSVSLHGSKSFGEPLPPRVFRLTDEDCWGIGSCGAYFGQSYAVGQRDSFYERETAVVRGAAASNVPYQLRHARPKPYKRPRRSAAR